MLGNILAKVMQAPAVVQQPAQSGSSSFQTMSVLQQDSTGESEEHLPIPPVQAAMQAAVQAAVQAAMQTAMQTPVEEDAPVQASQNEAPAVQAPVTARSSKNAITFADHFDKLRSVCNAAEELALTNGGLKHKDIKTKGNKYSTLLGITKGKRETEYKRLPGVSEATFELVVQCIKEFWTAMVASYPSSHSYTYVQNGYWARGDKDHAFSAISIAGVIGKMQPLVDFLDSQEHFPLQTLVNAYDLIQRQRIMLRLPELSAIDHTSRKEVCKALAAHNAEMVLSALKVGFPA